MNSNKYHIIEYTLKRMLLEKGVPETDNAPADADVSAFTPAEEKFLGKFDAYGTKHLGIIYSLSDVGIREFMSRSGADLNVTPGILLNLLKLGIIKIVPHGGLGRDDDYTIELQLSLDDVNGLGQADSEKIETEKEPVPAGGIPPVAPLPPMEVASVIKYGTLLQESVKIVKQLVTEAPKKQKKSVEIPTNKTRILKRLPAGYVYHLRKILDIIDSKTKTVNEKERLIADMLDILQLNLKLTPAQIKKSYEFHRNQKRLQKLLDNAK